MRSVSLSEKQPNLVLAHAPRLLGWLETGLLHEAGDPDIFAIGMQEIVDLSATNVVLDSMTINEKSGQGEKAAEDWVVKVRSLSFHLL